MILILTSCAAYGTRWILSTSAQMSNLLASLRLRPTCLHRLLVRLYPLVEALVIFPYLQLWHSGLHACSQGSSRRC